jgi:hypothetical protein
VAGISRGKIFHFFDFFPPAGLSRANIYAKIFHMDATQSATRQTRGSKMLTIYRYTDGKAIGTSSMDESDYLAQSQQPEGLIRLGAIPDDQYDLDEECQDIHEDTTVYMQ